jgi:hypothetical protein
MKKTQAIQNALVRINKDIFLSAHSMVFDQRLVKIAVNAPWDPFFYGTMFSSSSLQTMSQYEWAFCLSNSRIEAKDRARRWLCGLFGRMGPSLEE